MTILAAAAKGLDDLNVLVPVVQGLGKRHVGYGVKDEHYGIVGSTLLATLETGLGEAWYD
ncbi:MAG: hemoglobin-like flavoprotein [Cyclobacteriaceae bacterium]|jgi:hemoglobin-like flavoprotein